MIKYVDPLPPVLRFLGPRTAAPVYGNGIPASADLPALLVRQTGGRGYTRLQLLARAGQPAEAMSVLIAAMNVFEQQAAYIDGLRVTAIERESNPVHDRDADTNAPEAWVYLALHHIEA